MKRSFRRSHLRICLPIFLCLLALSFTLTSGIFARYTTKFTGSDEARVAAFVFQAESTGATEIVDIENNIKNPGDDFVYLFKVTNRDGAKICEVAQEYTVLVEIDGNMPLVCTLVKNSDPPLSFDTFTGSENSLNSIGTLAAGTEESDSFRLTVEWPDTENGAEYANGAAYGKIRLTVESKQTN